jgi:hypothetical protein
MCEFCYNKGKLLSKYVATEVFGQYTGDEELQIIIDRGYLRLGWTDDMECMDHGEKIKIKYCPICGRDLKSK